jgi:hypothetical protein
MRWNRALVAAMALAPIALAPIALEANARNGRRAQSR